MGRTSPTESQKEAKRLRDRERRLQKNEGEREVQLKRQRTRERHRLAMMTEEQREAKRQRDRERQKILSMSEEYRVKKRERDRQRRLRIGLSDEQREAKRQRDRERQRYKRMSVELREHHRERERARLRAKREAQRTRLLITEREESSNSNDSADATYMSLEDYALEYDSAAESDCESLGGDFDTDCETDEDADPAAQVKRVVVEYRQTPDSAAVAVLTVDHGSAVVDARRPNDPATVAYVCSQVQRALAGVCSDQCFVCDRLLNRRAVCSFDLQSVEEPRRQGVKRLLDGLVTVPGRYDLCPTCHSFVMRMEVPPSAVHNGFRYPAMPAGLRPLTEVEEHVLSLRQPFRQILLPGSAAVQGAVIYVPADAPDPAKPTSLRITIPLLPREDSLCVVDTQRQLVQKRRFVTSLLDAGKLSEWGRFLEKSTLYLDHGGIFHENRTDSKMRAYDRNSSFLGLDHPYPGALHHTLLMADVKSMAGVAWDPVTEELAMPSVYLGEPRCFKSSVSRYQVMRSEVRRVDRRGARPQSLLYKYEMHVREELTGRVRRKYKQDQMTFRGRPLAKEVVLDKINLTLLQMHGLDCLVPNSSEYWLRHCHDLLAMVRQLGLPHLFLTLSSAEYHAPTLLQVLQQLHQQHGQMGHVAGVKIEADAELPQEVCEVAMEAIQGVLKLEPDAQLTDEERLRLIRNDPVVCACYFREVVIQLKKYLHVKDVGPMGKYYAKDWFIRIDFQESGSPQAHCLMWLDQGPEQALDDADKTIKFVDDVLSCDSSHHLAAHNQHHHTVACFRSPPIRHRFATGCLDAKEAHRYCHFGAPYWPTPETRIVLPLSEESDERPEEERGDIDWSDFIEYLRDLRLDIKDVLASDDCPDTLEGVWGAAGCPDEATYLMAIRTGVNKPEVLYRRSVADRWTNPYLAWVLEAFEAHTNTQVVLDVRSLMQFAVDHVIKDEGHHSQLHEDVTLMRKEKDFDDRALGKILSSRKLGAKETSAQEAAWVLMRFPLYEMSRKCTFIDTQSPDDRLHSSKPARHLRTLPACSTNVWSPHVIDLYASRPLGLDDITLAEFAAFYHESKDFKRRHRPRIIRYRWFEESSENWEEHENFCRAMSTLHVPWRSESEILQIGKDTFQERYTQNEDAIRIKRAEFEATLDLHETLDEELEARAGPMWYARWRLTEAAGC